MRGYCLGSRVGSLLMRNAVPEVSRLIVETITCSDKGSDTDPFADINDDKDQTENKVHGCNQQVP